MVALEQRGANFYEMQERWWSDAIALRTFFNRRRKPTMTLNKSTEAVGLHL